jgi:beta-glucosidase/6-phospho-beta-glucosidase/beta-galactosidase
LVVKGLLDGVCCRLLDPLVFGDYPKIMRKLVGKRLPLFCTDETKDLKGSFDFIGLNYYTATNAKDKPFVPYEMDNHDSQVIYTRKSRKPIF